MEEVSASGQRPKAKNLQVSVIVPAYNADRTLTRTLDSIRGQTYGDWEAIVVNDGSTDTTEAIAEDYQRTDSRFRMVNRSNGGESAARNTGIDAASYPWLLFLDSDDWIAPSFFERMTGELSTNPRLDAVHCRWVRVAVDGIEIPESYRPPGGDMFPIWALRSAFPVHACIVRKAVVEEVGKFDESLRKSADWDLWQRVARTGARFGVVDEVLAYYRIKPGSASMDAERLLTDGLRVLGRGHAPDPRVKNALPEHSEGAPAEGLGRQKFYLLAWCGGLKIGAGDSALPLLNYLRREKAEFLDAQAIARSLFDSATLPTGKPPGAWEELWPRTRLHIESFLSAIEEQSTTIGLAAEAAFELKKMILTSSPTFGPLVDAAATVASHLERRAHALEGRLAKSGEQMAELVTWNKELENRVVVADERVADLIEYVQGLESRLAESDDRVAQLSQLAKELEHRAATSAAWVAELRHRSEFLEARLREASKPRRFKLGPTDIPRPVKWVGEIVFFRTQLLRLRIERFLALASKSGRRGRVLAIACWGFPIYSQSFVYEELLQLIRAGFRVRFAFSALNRDDELPSHFRPVWRARRRLILSKEAADASYAYFTHRMPDRVELIVGELSRESNLSADEIRGHHHFRQAFAFARMAEAYGPGYLHSYFFYEGTLFAFVASSLLDIPRGVTTYADHMLDDYALKVVGVHLRQCTVIIATSERIKSELLAIEPEVPTEAILVKPNGIDPNRFPIIALRTPAHGENIGLVSVSRIEPKKGLVYLVEAAAILRDRGLPVTVRIVGQVENNEASRGCDRDLRARIDAKALTEVVRFEGKLSESGIKDVFRLSQVFVAPYIETDQGDKDGIPTALLEAMSSGLAVVATDAGSIPEVIVRGQEGLLVPQRDPEALAVAIATLIESPDERARLGANAARRIRAEFDASLGEMEFHDHLAAVLSGELSRVEEPVGVQTPGETKNP